MNTDCVIVKSFVHVIQCYTLRWRRRSRCDLSTWWSWLYIFLFVNKCFLLSINALYVRQSLCRWIDYWKTKREDTCIWDSCDICVADKSDCRRWGHPLCHCSKLAAVGEDCNETLCFEAQISPRHVCLIQRSHPESSAQRQRLQSFLNSKHVVYSTQNK